MATTIPSTTSNRWQIITNIWQKEQWLYGFVGALAGFIFGIAASGKLGNIVNWFASGFWNEALSIAITVIVLDRLNALRMLDERKQALFQQLKSRSNDLAIDALEQIQQHEDWWSRAIESHRKYVPGVGKVIDLHGIQWAGGVNLSQVQIPHAILEQANLTGAILENVDFSYARLFEANLSGTELNFANLTHAALGLANLRNSNLLHSKIKNANLTLADLTNANLHFADLSGSIMQGAKFIDAILSNVNLNGSDLNNADLSHSNLHESNFRNAGMGYANLSNTDLQSANLENAILYKAKLLGANLCNSNLRGANLTEAIFDEKTILPDANLVEITNERGYMYDKYWTPNVDMTRYTDPNHLTHWQPHYLKDGYHGHKPVWLRDAEIGE
jgi:uncharacterized protein YjbI with pentapeptide repeats